MSTLFSHFFCLFLKIVSVSLKTRHSMFSPAHKYGILRQKEVCRLKDNRIHFDLERKLRRYAISDLMKYIVIGQGIVFALLYIWPTLGYQLYSLITLTRTGLMRGQIWRLVSFIFMPPSSSPVFLLISLMFYWYLGTSLQNTWGTFRFTVYYLCGMLGAILAGLITGYATNTYLNLSLFLACAVLFPETEVNLIIIPVKMKWLSLVYLLPVVQQLLTSNLWGILALVMSLLNVILFFYGDLIQRIRDFRRRQQWKRNWK